jgi:hypothetical protein
MSEEPPRAREESKSREEFAREVAKQITKRMIEPILARDLSSEPLSFLDLLWAGAYITETSIKFWRNPLDRELYDAARSRDLQQLEAVLYKRILALSQPFTLHEINEELDQIKASMRGARGFRQLHLGVIRKALPPEPAGREPKIEPSDYDALADLSQELRPAIARLLAIRKHVPKQAIPEVIKLLASDFSQQIVAYLLEHATYLEEQNKAIPKTKTEKFRSRWLADVLAGKRWSLKPSYAAKICKIARASARKVKQSGG